MSQKQSATNLHPPAGRRLWLFRPDKQIAFQNYALEDGILVPEFGIRGELRDHFELEDIQKEMEEANPGEEQHKIESWAKQLHLLLHGIMPGDFIVMPLSRDPEVAIGIARPEVVVTADNRPGRRVEWLTKPVSRNVFLPDLQHSMQAKQHVCGIVRNNAAERIVKILETGQDPGPEADARIPLELLDAATIEMAMRSRMIAKIGSSFAGHALASLITELLQIDGYRCSMSPPGPDGGVDILAGRGVLALESALVVQVKSGDIVADAPTLQQLVGAMSSHGADHGLLVSWGGVTRNVRARISENWFKVRVWSAEDVCDAVERNYDDLSRDIRDRLGFRRILAI